MILLQVPSSLWNTTGSVTVVGVLLVLIALLLSGYLSPGRAVSELKNENTELRVELAAVNGKYIEQVKRNGEITGELEALRGRLEWVERELALLRGRRNEGA